MWHEGDLLTIDWPDNPRLHEKPGMVKHVTTWGVIAATPASATGEIRLTFDEMKPFRENDRGQKTVDWSALGYTGDICRHCAGCRMVRNGACLLCTECGASSGCS